MVALALADAKTGLIAVSSILNASPIPDPFKSAVALIPTTALAIVTMVEVRSRVYILVICD